jgi:hypothetical protein
MANSLATALYLELRRGKETSQVIIAPQVYNPIVDKTQKSTIITRQISELVPKRSWRYYQLKNTPMIEKGDDVERTISNISPLIEELSPFLVGYVSGGWTLFHTPIAVEMSSADLDDIANSKTPAAFIRRLMKARTEAKFPDQLFEVAEPELVGYSPTVTTPPIIL